MQGLQPMKFIAIALMGLCALILLIYFHAFFRFGRILRAERPELFGPRSPVSYFLMPGPPEFRNPFVAATILNAAFGSTARGLDDPDALTYAWRIRLGAIILLSAFIYLVSWVVSRGP
jgi:hypothetical protein